MWADGTSVGFLINEKVKEKEQPELYVEENYTQKMELIDSIACNQGLQKL